MSTTYKTMKSKVKSWEREGGNDRSESNMMDRMYFIGYNLVNLLRREGINTLPLAVLRKD